MPNRRSARIIALTLTRGSAMRPRTPHLGQVKMGEEICRSDLICCSIVSRESLSAINAANDIASPHSRSSLASISGNQTLCESPAGIEDCSLQSIRHYSSARCDQLNLQNWFLLATMGRCNRTSCCLPDDILSHFLMEATGS